MVEDVNDNVRNERLEALKLEYKEVNSYWRTLTVIRFKLLAFVPTLAGLGVVVIPNADDIAPLEAFAIGLFGFIATLGITFYDQRNSELYNASINRASDLECEIPFGCKYLFTWDNVPGDDSNSLLEYLKDYHDIDWAKSRDIKKTADLKTIKIDKGKNSAEIKIDANEKVTLEINEAVQQSKIGRIRKAYSALNQKLRKIFGVKINCETASNDGEIRDLKVKKVDNKLKIYKVGGIFNLRPKRSRTFFGILMWHDRALAMVYASALGAWLFIIISSILKLILWPSGTFSLLLSVLLAIVIYKILPKDAGTSRGKSHVVGPQGEEEG